MISIYVGRRMKVRRFLPPTFKFIFNHHDCVCVLREKLNLDVSIIYCPNRSRTLIRNRKIFKTEQV